MADRVDISHKVSALKKISLDVMGKIIPIMKILVDDSNELTEEIAHNLDLPEKAIPEINEWLRDYTNTLIQTSRTVVSEIDKFASAYAQGDEYLDKNMDKYEMLANVWFGDVYDESGIQAFDLLEKDLKVDLDNSTENNIINQASSQKFD